MTMIHPQIAFAQRTAVLAGAGLSVEACDLVLLELLMRENVTVRAVHNACRRVAQVLRDPDAPNSAHGLLLDPPTCGGPR